jgi:DNA processing protein
VKDSERLAWLRLARTENIGPVTFAALIARFGTAEAALEAVPAMAARGGKPEFVIPPEAEIAREFAALEKIGGAFLFSCEPQFPHGLAALEPPPPVLALLGHAHLLRADMVAMVGARNASALGRKLARMMARELGEAGLAIVSGLARGIDAAAHEAALDSGTVAVVAGGIDIVYPPENQALYDAIRERGVIVSEMRLGEAPQARHFPRRNRLISGLARGVVVVEAAERSGSLITAQYALEQGREIFAVPGSPLDPRARGCNKLLREGATLTEGAADVMAVLRPILGADFREPDHGMPAPPPANWEAEADKVRARVEEALGPAPVAVDELIRQLGAAPGAVLTVLLELELAGGDLAE